MFRNRIDRFDEYDNRITDLEQEKLELVKRLSDIEKEKEKLQLERRDFGIQYYGNKLKRQKLFELADKYGYSPEKLNEMRPLLETWNQDVVNNEELDSLRIIEKFVNDNQESYTQSIFYKVYQCFTDKGGNSNEN